MLVRGKMGVNVSLKLHFLDAHLDRFPENYVAYSDEHDFHQEMLSIEERFKGECVRRMLSEYCRGSYAVTRILTNTNKRIRRQNIVNSMDKHTIYLNTRT